MARAHLVALAARTSPLAATEEGMFLDIDSLLRPVYGKAKQGASFGHAEIASRALLRLGLSPQITTISTASAAPVIAEAQLRSGKAASGLVAPANEARYVLRTPAFSSAFQNGSRSSRLSTLAAPDNGSGVSRNSTERGHL